MYFTRDEYLLCVVAIDVPFIHTGNILQQHVENIHGNKHISCILAWYGLHIASMRKNLVVLSCPVAGMDGSWELVAGMPLHILR